MAIERRDADGRSYAERYTKALRDLETAKAARSFLERERVPNLDGLAGLMRTAFGATPGEPPKPKLAEAPKSAPVSPELERRRAAVVSGAKALSTALARLGAALRPINARIDVYTATETTERAAETAAELRSRTYRAVAERIGRATAEGVPMDLAMVGDEFVSINLERIHALIDALTRWSRDAKPSRKPSGRPRKGDERAFERLVFFADAIDLSGKHLAALACMAGVFADVAGIKRRCPRTATEAGKLIRHWENLQYRAAPSARLAADWLPRHGGVQWDNREQREVTISREIREREFRQFERQRRTFRPSTH